MSKDHEKDAHAVISDLTKILKEKDEIIKSLQDTILEMPSIEYLNEAQEKIEDLSDKMLFTLVSRKSEIEKYLKLVVSFATSEMLGGRDIKNLKLTKKSKNRAYIDLDKAIEFLRGEGYTDEQILKTTLKTPAQLEDVVPSHKIAKIVHLPIGDDTVKSIY